VFFGVAFSALKAFGHRAMGSEWEEEIYQRELDRLRQKRGAGQTDQKKLAEPGGEDLELKELEELKRKWEDQDFV
jgi:hypothetical protein